MRRNQGLTRSILFALPFGLFVLPAMLAQSVAPLHLGDALPDVIGQNPSGTPAHLSTQVAGKVAVVVFSFSKSGGKDTQLWNKNLSREFGSDRSVGLSTVIMLESAPRILRGLIVSKLKKEMPVAIVSYENEKLWKQRLGVADDSHAYVVLLKPDGKILWMNSGAFSDAEYKDLKTNIQKQSHSANPGATLQQDPSSYKSWAWNHVDSIQTVFDPRAFAAAQ